MPLPDRPFVDAHTHLFYDRPYLTRLFETAGLRVGIINITGRHTFAASMQRRWEAMTAMKARYPDHVALCTTFDPVGVAEPDFAARTIDALREHLRQGAAMVKVWKDVGLELRDADGRFVQVDDPRFRPIWDFLAHEGVPVLAHIAEPRAAWQPLDARSPHFRYYRDHPTYHLHGRDDVPAWETVIDARDRWLAQNPGLTVVGAHLGSMAYDVRLVAERLDAFPNFHVDTAERFGDLVVQPSDRVRAFCVAYASRILYGTDVIVETPAEAGAAAGDDAYEALVASHWAYFADHARITIQDKLVDPVEVDGLGLSTDVLRRLFHDNAASLLGFDA